MYVQREPAKRTITLSLFVVDMFILARVRGKA